MFCACSITGKSDIYKMRIYKTHIDKMRSDKSHCGKTALCGVLALLLVACNGNDVPERHAPNDPQLLGYTTVALDANKNIVRAIEAPVGNMVADAMVERLSTLGFVMDAACINGGDLRFNVELRPDGIIPPGELRRGDIDNLLPFPEKIVVLQITGAQLRSAFERSVAQLPSDRPKGAYLQVSQTVRVLFDLSKPAQIIDEVADPDVIVSEGQRVVALSLRGIAVQDNATYTVGFTEFISVGGDGHVGLSQVPAERRSNSNILLADMVADHIQLYTPMSPHSEGRIVYVTAP